MKEQTYHIYLDSHEKTTLLHSLVELKNQLIQQGRYTDCEYSRAMKSHFRKFGNQMSGSGNHLCNYASLLA